MQIGVVIVLISHEEAEINRNQDLYTLLAACIN